MKRPVLAALLVLGLAGCYPTSTATAPRSPADAAPTLSPPGLTAPQPPLPALELPYNSPGDRTFAVQASGAARRGDCRAAVQNGKQLSVDARHKLEAVDGAYARCLETQP